METKDELLNKYKHDPYLFMKDFIMKPGQIFDKNHEKLFINLREFLKKRIKANVPIEDIIHKERYND